MILHPAIIALLSGAVMVSAMVLYSSLFGIGIVRKWDLRSGSETQLALEKKTYLISTVMSYAFGFQLISLFLFIYTADSLCSLFVGAMCAAGTLNVNAFGYPAFILKIANFILAGVWLVLNHADSTAHDYPLIRWKYSMLFCITPLLIAETYILVRYFLGLDADVITSCCGSLFSSEGQDAAAALQGPPAVQLQAVFYLALAATAVSGLYFLRKESGAYIFSALSLTAFVVSAWFMLHVVVLYIYELPTHHCPFCIFKKEYNFLGYPLYITLFSGGISGIGVGVLNLFRSVISLSSSLPRMQKRLALTALSSYALFFLIAAAAIMTSAFRI